MIDRLLRPPPRRRGMEMLELPGVTPQLLRRSLTDVARCNALFGGRSAVLGEVRWLLPTLPRTATLLDVGTGLGDIPAHTARLCARHGIRLTTIGLDGAHALALASRDRTSVAVCGDARALPLPDRSVDIVVCSQLLHHFADDDIPALVRELDRVARLRVIISDLRRSWFAAGGLWLVSFPLAFHPVSRHDGMLSVMRGFTPAELDRLIGRAIGKIPGARRRRGFRVIASWQPNGRPTS